MTRNNKIFKQINASTQGCKALFMLEMDALLLRAKKKLFTKVTRMDKWNFLIIKPVVVHLLAFFISFLVP